MKLARANVTLPDVTREVFAPSMLTRRLGYPVRIDTWWDHLRDGMCVALAIEGVSPLESRLLWASGRLSYAEAETLVASMASLGEAVQALVYGLLDGIDPRQLVNGTFPC